MQILWMLILVVHIITTRLSSVQQWSKAVVQQWSQPCDTTRQPANQGNTVHMSRCPSRHSINTLDSEGHGFRVVRILFRGVCLSRCRILKLIQNPSSILPVSALLSTWRHVCKMNCYQSEYVQRSQLFIVTSSKQQQFVLRNQLLLLHQQSRARASHA